MLHEAINSTREKLQNKVKYTGDRIANKCEFYNYPKNMLILCPTDSNFSFIPIHEGKILDTIDDINDDRLLDIFEWKPLVVMDIFAHRYNIHDVSEFNRFINKIYEARGYFDVCKDKYHKYMKAYCNYNELKDLFPNRSIDKNFENCIELCEEYARELRQLLIPIKTKANGAFGEYITQTSEDERIADIFGLYVAVLRAYNLSRSFPEPTTTAENVYFGFLKEFHYFLKKHPNILDKYKEIYKLKKHQYLATENLLKTYNLYDSEWECDRSELSI